jgi:hypothetical protein
VILAMPNELTVPAVQAALVPGTAPVSHPAPVANTPAPVQVFTNPSLRLDPALGLVVIEFRNDSGTVTRSIPNQQQLEAYKLHEKTPPDPDQPPE